MTREIEYRAKSKGCDKWMYGFPLDDNYFCGYFKNPEGYFDFETFKDLRPETVGQLWATINNKNGVKIFEGDIISFGSSLVCVIIYNEVNKCFSSIDKSEYNRLQFCDELSKLNILANLGYAKVEFISALLGNIFDNPELLK